MPGFYENPQPMEEPDIASEFEDWLNAAADRPGGITVYDIDMMEVVLMVRLRSVFTEAQLHQRCHALIQFAEQVIQTEGGLIDEDGNPQPPILVENFQGDAEDLQAMHAANQKGISDEDIAAFLEGEDTE